MSNEKKLKKKIPKTRDDYEWDMIWAFNYGMQNGYGIEHTNIHEEEEKAIREFAERCGFKRKGKLWQ